MREGKFIKLIGNDGVGRVVNIDYIVEFYHQKDGDKFIVDIGESHLFITKDSYTNLLMSVPMI